MNRLALTAGAIAIVAVSAGVAYRAQRQAEEPAVAPMPGAELIGTSRPEFTLPDVQGLARSVSEWDGRVVALNFWATWCPPCIQELPSLNNIHERFRDRGLVVVGISVDEDKEAYQKFLQQRGVTFPTARDPQQTVNIRYGTTKFPESYLIDREGYVRRKYVGPEDWERPEIVNYLGSLL